MRTLILNIYMLNISTQMQKRVKHDINYNKTRNEVVHTYNIQYTYIHVIHKNIYVWVIYKFYIK